MQSEVPIYKEYKEINTERIQEYENVKELNHCLLNNHVLEKISANNNYRRKPGSPENPTTQRIPFPYQAKASSCIPRPLQ